MSDIRLACAFSQHPKTRKLQRRLGAAGPWALVCLFLWARLSKPDGDLGGMDDEDIEIAADWQGEQGALIGALLGCGFIEGELGKRCIHDWADHQPWSAGSDARSQSSKWAALCKRYGRDEAARRMPEYAERMRPARAPDATRTPPACGTDAPLPSPSPSPSPSPNLPTTSGASAEEPDFIWSHGLAWMKRKGVPEGKARSTLGLAIKESDRLTVADLLQRAESEDVVEPVAWLIAAVKARRGGQIELLEPVKASHRPLGSPRG